MVIETVLEVSWVMPAGYSTIESGCRSSIQSTLFTSVGGTTNVIWKIVDHTMVDGAHPGSSIKGGQANFILGSNNTIFRWCWSS